MPFTRADLHELAKTAAVLAQLRRVGAQFLAPDDHGARVFGRLDRHGHDARGKRRCIQPVMSGRRPNRRN